MYVFSLKIFPFLCLLHASKITTSVMYPWKPKMSSPTKTMSSPWKISSFSTTNATSMPHPRKNVIVKDLYADTKTASIRELPNVLAAVKTIIATHANSVVVSEVMMIFLPKTALCWGYRLPSPSLMSTATSTELKLRLTTIRFAARSPSTNARVRYTMRSMPHAGNVPIAPLC